MITEKDIILCGHGSGHPRTIRMDEYLTSRYKQSVTKKGKTWRKGVVAVVRPKKITDELRKKYVAKYKTIIGRNSYSQTKRKHCYKPYDDGKYYSDCSSSQNLTFAEIGMDMPAYNTEEMYQSSRYEKVPVKIQNGHITNPEILKVADQLLFAGSDPDREECIGHVEGIMEIGSGTGVNSIKDFQCWLNEYHMLQVILATGQKLSTDGEYGRKTRAAALGVFKYMLNKYYEAHLTVENDNFYDSTKAAAEKVTLAEVKKHGSLAAVLQGTLAYAGCYSNVITAKVDKDTEDALKKFKKAHGKTADKILTGEIWQMLFEVVK